MRDVTATEAARRFSELLDAVEHRQESFVVTRNGHPIARIGPAAAGNGGELTDFLGRHDPDPGWAEDLRAVRAILLVEDREWPG